MMHRLHDEIDLFEELTTEAGEQAEDALMDVFDEAMIESGGDFEELFRLLAVAAGASIKNKTTEAVQKMAAMRLKDESKD